MDLFGRIRRWARLVCLTVLLASLTPVPAHGQGPSHPSPPPSGGPIEVLISGFKKLGGPSRLDQLELALPRILMMSLLRYPWLDVSISETRRTGQAVAVPGPNPSDGALRGAIPPFMIDGTFIQIQDKVRVDVAIRNPADGSIFFGESTTSTEEGLISSIYALGERIANDLRGKSSASLTKQLVGFAVITPFRNNSPEDRSSVASALGVWLPDLITALLSQSRLKTVIFRQMTEQQSADPQSGTDAVISGSYLVSGDQVTITTTIQEMGVPVIHLNVSGPTDRVAVAPEKIAKQIADIIRARITPEGEWRKERISLTSARPGEYLGEAKAYEDKGEYPRAILMYRKAIETSPDQTEPHLGLASVYLQQNDYDSAASEYQEVLRLDANSGPGKVGLGTVDLLKNNYSDAIQYFQEALRTLPVDSDLRQTIYTRLGHAYLLQGNSDSAIPNYLNALRADSSEPEAYRFLSIAYLSAGNRTEATEWLEKGLKRFPDDPRIKADLASAYKRSGMESFGKRDYDAALKSFERLLTIGAADSSIGAGTYARMREAYHYLHRDKDSLRVMNAQLAKNPRNLHVLGNLSLIYHDYLGEFQKGYEINQTIFAMNPKSATVRSNLAESCLATDRFDQATALANELLADEALPVAEKLSMRLITISSLVLLGKRAEAFTQLSEFVAYYKMLPSDYDRTWTYSGTKRFVSEHRKLRKADRDLILSLVDILESPKAEADKKLQMLEASLPDRLKQLHRRLPPPF